MRLDRGGPRPPGAVESADSSRRRSEIAVRLAVSGFQVAPVCSGSPRCFASRCVRRACSLSAQIAAPVSTPTRWVGTWATSPRPEDKPDPSIGLSGSADAAPGGPRLARRAHGALARLQRLRHYAARVVWRAPCARRDPHRERSDSARVRPRIPFQRRPRRHRAAGRRHALGPRRAGFSAAGKSRDFDAPQIGAGHPDRPSRLADEFLRRLR